MMGEWDFTPDVIRYAQEIGIGARVRVHWSEAECQDQEATVVGVQIERNGKVSYSLHIDGDVSPTDGFYYDITGRDVGSISLLPDLSAVALPDELEEVAQAHFDGECELCINPLEEAIERLEPVPGESWTLVRASQAHSTIAALRAERDEAVDRAKVWEHYWQHEVKVKGEVISWCKDYQAKLETAEAEVKRLTEEKEALRKALGNMRCPRPCNHRPDEFDAKDCVAAGECGCGAAILSDGGVNAPS